MSYDAPRNSNVYMMIGYDANSASDGGFVEQDVPKPTLVAPQAWDKQVKGTGVSGNQIVIKDQVGKVLGTGTVGSDNSYSVGLSRPLVYNETITATQLNQDKVASDPVDATVEDTVAPDAPKAQNIEVSDQMLSGSAETGSKILAKNAQGKIVGEGAATGKAISKSNDSEFSFELTEPVTVGETITVTATDSAGLESTGTDVKVVDTVKPTAPKVNAVDDTMKQLTGTGSKVGSTIVASVNNQVFYGKVGADKTFTVNLGRTFSGGTLIKVIEIDQQNQQSDPTVVTVKGTQKTKTPTVNTVGDSDLELTGTAEPNADVTVTIGQDVYKGKADQNGNFKIQLNQKYPITSEGTVIATGTSGIASDAEKIKFEDTTPPNAPAINSVLPTDTTLSGTAEPNSTVRVVFTRPDGSTAVFQKPADKDGNFKINMLGTFPEGTTISATAEDAAGNISSAANAIVASKEKPTLSLSDLSSQDIQLTGTATRANTPVTVQVGDQVYQTKTDDGGKFILHLDRMFPAGTEVTATMGIGDKIGKANTTVLLRMPTFTTSNSPRVGMKKITLKADPNSDVTLTITHLDGGLGDIQTVQADEAGNATFTLVSPIRYGDTLDVFSTMLGVKNPSERGEISIF
ncbi:hypothetical protein MFLO_10693 [Listeria floridensis FSL S10-1187]|uniref:Bacterial Ig domain-containing protein n=2 Tax=Listeria floridensis TaxID=1494962 RepID=A0ABN0RDU0_9LIST|nr:Ig-like domain-containing protein [Listeria floridensis]EUJ30284.1 hypothetical protein MFLO_10693 [Listeria floridensis FSL S10-1187]